MLAILTTHPIQYQVPLWQALAKDGSVPFEVWYLTDHGTKQSYDEQFGKTFAWDLDTLSGYPHRFLRVNRDVNVSRFRGVRLAESLTKLLKEKNVDVLWVQGWQVMAYWQAIWQAHKAGVQVWLRGESNDLAPRSPSVFKRFAKRILLKQLFSRVDHFLYIGQANKRLYESYGVRPEQLHSTPYGVDNERFSRQANELLNQRSSLRRKWKIPDNAFCVLFAGKFIPKKRPFDLIAAVRNIQHGETERPIHLLFVGSGELDQSLRQTCQVVFDAGVQSIQAAKTEDETCNDNSGNGALAVSASFPGFLNQTEISKAYVAADCLVLPSDHETWGLVVNEAMASGLPCLASDMCGCSEDMINPLDSRLCFSMGDTRALASSLVACMEHPCFAIKSRDHVEKFSLAVSVEVIKKLYHY
jgi:glycosyltransferase involved in cell wall biosynthesis